VLVVAAGPTVEVGLVGPGLLRGTRTVEVALAVVALAKAVAALAVVALAKAVAAVASKTAGPAVEVNRTRTEVSVGVVVTQSGAPLCALLAIGCC
jgi:hypothetical protein